MKKKAINLNKLSLNKMTIAKMNLLVGGNDEGGDDDDDVNTGDDGIQQDPKKSIDAIDGCAVVKR